MDLSTIYSIVLLILVVVVLGIRIFALKSEGKPLLATAKRSSRKKTTSTSKSTTVWGRQKSSDDTDSDHDVGIEKDPILISRRINMAMDELKSMEYDELRERNHLNQRTTDRYWREIYRRNNNGHLPDVINLNHLTKKNAITALDERLPRGGLHGTEEFRIVAGRGDNSDGDVLQEHVIKYLRRRYPTNYEINTADDGTIQITRSRK